MSISTPLARHILLRGKTSARIIAVPLSRPLVPVARRLGNETSISSPNALGPLTYYQFQLLDDLKARQKEGVKEGRVSRLASWAQSKVVGMWDGFGKAEGGWRVSDSFVLESRLFLTLSAHTVKCTQSRRTIFQQHRFRGVCVEEYRPYVRS
jgi:hypothetical protein